MRTDFEPDADLGILGDGWGQVDPNAPLDLNPINAEPSEKFDDAVSEDVLGLLHLGRLTSHCRVFGHDFELRTLTAGDKLIIGQIVQRYGDTLGLDLSWQIATLAASIVTVDSRQLVAALGPGTENRRTVIERAFAIIQDWYEATIEEVFAEYNALLLKQATAFSELAGK